MKVSYVYYVSDRDGVSEIEKGELNVSKFELKECIEEYYKNDESYEYCEEYQETLKKSDIKWAERYLESENAEDNGDLEETAYGITGFGENLIDTGKSFCNDSND